MKLDLNVPPAVRSAFRLANQICTVLDRSLCLGVAWLDPQNPLGVSFFSQWVGEAPLDKTNAPWRVLMKAAELIAALPHRQGDWNLLVTPLAPHPEPKWTFDQGLAGGVAFGDFVVAASQWDALHDKLVVLTILNHLAINPLRIHHGGFRVESEGALEEWKNSPRFSGVRWYARPAQDPPHQRYYGWLPAAACWVEGQLFDDPALRTPAQHFDVVVASPHSFLGWVAARLATAPTIWEAGPKDPVGAVSVNPQGEGFPLTVMARFTYWHVQRG